MVKFKDGGSIRAHLSGDMHECLHSSFSLRPVSLRGDCSDSLITFSVTDWQYVSCFMIPLRCKNGFNMCRLAGVSGH